MDSNDSPAWISWSPDESEDSLRRFEQSDCADTALIHADTWEPMLSPDRLDEGGVTRGRRPQRWIPRVSGPSDRVPAPAVREHSFDTTRAARIVRRIGIIALPRD
jgi:hypothetical protein